jgi:predicted metalloprotease
VGGEEEEKKTTKKKTKQRIGVPPLRRLGISILIQAQVLLPFALLLSMTKGGWWSWR